jgi:hypothetical protein
MQQMKIIEIATGICYFRKQNETSHEYIFGIKSISAYRNTFNGVSDINVGVEYHSAQINIKQEHNELQ